MAMVQEIVLDLDAADTRSNHRRQVRLSIEAVNTAAGAAERVLMLDLSETGFLMRGLIDVQAGEVLDIALSEGATVEAVVAWSRDDLYGCRFVTPISRGAVSAMQLRSPALHDTVIAMPEIQRAVVTYSPRRKVAIWIGLGALCWAPVIAAASLVI